MNKPFITAIIVFIVAFINTVAFAGTADPPGTGRFDPARTQYHTINVENIDIFYREAGEKRNPTIVLLHGFPTSSHMFRNLIPALSDQFHLVAPDYPGFGNSAMPGVKAFDYTFDRLADVMEAFLAKLSITRYSLYVMDYAPPA